MFRNKIKRRGNDDFGCSVVIGLLGIIAAVIIVFKIKSYQAGYKQGQIDYANEIIKYELVTEPSGETIWRLKEEFQVPTK